MVQSASLDKCCVSLPSHHSKPPAQQALHSMSSQQPEPRSGQHPTCRKRQVLSPSFISEWTTPADEPGYSMGVKRTPSQKVTAHDTQACKCLHSPALVAAAAAAQHGHEVMSTHWHNHCHTCTCACGHVLHAAAGQRLVVAHAVAMAQLALQGTFRAQRALGQESERAADQPGHAAQSSFASACRSHRQSHYPGWHMWFTSRMAFPLACTM